MRFLLPSLSFLCIALILAPIKAEHKPIVPDEEWTPETQLVAARMLYGEASFAFQDVQILNIAKRRQELLNTAQQRKCQREGIPEDECPYLTFLDAMQAYSFAIKPGHDKDLRRMLQHAKSKRAKATSPEQLRRYTKRANNLRKRLRRWKQVQEMPWGDYEGWSSNYNKERCNKKWATIRNLVVRWNEGYIRDACPNTTHWGGRLIDPIHSGYREQPCHNTAGGLLPQRTETVNAMLTQSTDYRFRAKRVRRTGGSVSASAVKKAFQETPLFTNIR